MNRKYLIIGSGRLATHLKHYLNLKAVKFESWSRQKNSISELKSLIEQFDYILIAISDDALNAFIHTNTFLTGKNLIHFSGSLSIPGTSSAHPLMSFSDSMYDLDTYEKIPFITERGKLSFQEIFPDLNNSSYEIDPQQKEFYHALCSASGNFTSIIWSNVFYQFEKRLGISKEVLFPYLTQITTNLIEDSDNAVTGPLVRGDKNVIAKHVASFQDNPLQPVYKEMVNFYINTREES